MTERLTYHDTLGLSEVVEIGGDLLLLPEQERAPYEELRALQNGGMIPLEGSTIGDAVLHIFEMQPAYDTYRNTHGTEPSWVLEKPVRVQRYLRYTYAITQEEPLGIMNTFPYTGVSYMVRDGGLCEYLERTFSLRRLQDIKQLGFLQAPWLRDRLYNIELAPHRRFGHSLDVMTLASLIGHNLKLPEHLFNTLRAAAFTHDMGTPAGGDSVKLVDLPAFDEDENYGRLLALREHSILRSWYGVDDDLLVETILNKGLLGQILDIADKLAYVARDLHECEPYISFVANDPETLEGPGLRTIQELLKRFPYVCSLWDSATLVEGQLAFTDARRLGAFLKVRVLLFRELYFHPNARFGEYLVSRVLVKALYDAGCLTRDELLLMGDSQLNQRLDAAYGSRNIIESISKARPRCETFRTRESADKRLVELRKEGNPFAILEDNSKLIKTGTHFLVETESGLQAFREAYPGDAREIEEMARLLPAVHVYWLQGEPPVSKDLLASLYQRATA